MYVETKDLNRMTITFLGFIQNKMNHFIEKDPCLERDTQIIDYARINDSDKPGIIEEAVIKVGERMFKGTYWHNDHYRKFVEL